MYLIKGNSEVSESRLLVVEPDEKILSRLADGCTPFVSHIDCATTYPEAQQLLSKNAYDICVAPVSFTDHLGFPFYQLCLSTRKDTRLILRCEISEVMDAIKATRDGAFAFFPWKGPATEFTHLITAATKVVKRRDDASWRKRMVHKSSQIDSLLDEIQHVSGSENPVHITGPSGSGKSLCAELIHQASKRRNGGFVAVDCRTAIDEELSNLLFGHAPGAFEGALERESGALEQANDGVLLLHHVDAMPMSVQLQFIKALHQKAYRPLGSENLIHTNYRLITSSDRDLESELNAGRFSEELYQLILSLELKVPSLSERAEDIPEIARIRAEKIYKRKNQVFKGYSAQAMRFLIQGSWPGNVRQLTQVIDKVLNEHPNRTQVSEVQIKSVLKDQPRAVPTYSEAKAKFEREYLIHLMSLTSGNVAQAARIADRNRTDFYKLLSRNNLEAATFKQAGRTSDNDQNQDSVHLRAV